MEQSGVVSLAALLHHVFAACLSSRTTALFSFLPIVRAFPSACGFKAQIRSRFTTGCLCPRFCPIVRLVRYNSL